MNRSPADPAASNDGTLTPISSLRLRPCGGCGILIGYHLPWCSACGDALVDFYQAAAEGRDLRTSSPWVTRALAHRTRYHGPEAVSRRILDGLDSPAGAGESVEAFRG